MTRYIFIDRNSGYIWGDSADIDGKVVNGTPCEVAKALDESIGDFIGLEYWETNSKANDVVYDVYRADVREIPLVQDGTDQRVINAVSRGCDYVTAIGRRLSEAND